jgi:hypothetical protein
MKKILALVLALLLAVSLLACAEKSGDEGSAPSPEASAPASTVPSTAPSTAPSDAPASAEPSPEAPAEGGTVGLHPDEVDHFARDPYKIVYMVCQWVPINASLSDQFEAWGKVMNYTYESFNAQADLDNFLVQLQTFAAQSFDGFLLDFDNSISSRVNDICSELDLNWITALNPCVDENGHMLGPGVTLDAYDMGQTLTLWLSENYSKYWGEIDTSKLGFITIYASDMPDLRNRGIGAQEKFVELYPDLADSSNFTVDIAGLGIAPDVGYDKVAALMSAHPEVEHWFITSCMETLAQGAARAAESLTKGDCTLVANIDAATLMSEWDGGYTGSCWVMSLFTSPIYQTEPMVCGLVAMIDGRAEPENLWPDWIADGERYANLVLTPEVVTIDNYKQCLADAEAYAAQYGG